MLSEAQRARLRGIRRRAVGEAAEWRAAAVTDGLFGVAAEECAYRALRADYTIAMCDNLLSRAPEQENAG